ncbi:acyl-ACP--UDP-N- acetylglucosamine O-acyltransferase [Ruminococcus sp. OA3]|uniref:acyl-ACP--UDP-N- acetylglucosamine O-acyltransferase n=1 Tax=Ruminococcus sp. OA3 TaxID=2914164 RepID=UPI001F05984D|nr:acyl-ACP--UDP-N- acetylglucosamine O-acyltransferase [Ruminococcus sp. OA3]MCH1984419.1 acyl-ACP--UDP-N- acetylglucosamine O-acyltransferase [Ruminococcus sp. OA3]
MKEYELYCEYYDTCSPKPRTSIEEIETDNIESYMSQFITDDATVSCNTNQNGDILYEICCAGIRKRYTFTEI